MAATSSQARTMVARVSPDDIVIYANTALSAYLHVPKRDLIGSPLEIVAQRCRGEIAECFRRPEGGRTTNRLVTDVDGKVFEVKTYSEGGVLDLVLDEVTTAENISRELGEASGTPVEELNEEELRTARHPERRHLTVTYTQLSGLARSIERLAPMEARLMVGSFIEEAGDAIFETGCSVGETLGDAVLGIFGAPRYFADHTLRAVRAACEQAHKATQLRGAFYREGKELPPCSCGIWTGDTFIGTLGNSSWQHYTALGTPVELAEKLCHLARPGEILLPDHTLQQMLKVLPAGWQHIRAESEEAPDLSDFQWSGEEIAPLPENLRKVVYLIGPDIIEQTEHIEYYLDYLWALRVPGIDEPVPILRVVRPTAVGDSLTLRDDNVVAARNVQMLGKYKLFEVIGTGGMGKVWRGVDRFGNAVAIKVLHAGEGLNESVIKRFHREAEVMARLPHRNICRVYEMNEFEGMQYLSMEYVEGLTLSDLLYERTSAESSGQAAGPTDLRTLIRSIRSERTIREAVAATGPRSEEPAPRPKVTRILPVEQTLNIFLKVCDAVQFAHEHGVLHRDLKPGNILLREDGEPLVADFGLAKWDADGMNSLSVTGHVVGTMENMAPEQAESSKDVDERADVYSLGTILYQMLTGHRHFDATGNIVADAQNLQVHEPKRLRLLNSQLDPDLEIITLKALRKDPAERYRNVEAFKTDLERFRRGEVISAKPVSYGELVMKLILRNRTVSAVAAVSVFIIVGMTGFFIWQLKERLDSELVAKAQADEQRKLAQKQTKIAEERTEYAEVQAQEAARQAEIAKAALELQKQLEDAKNQAKKEAAEAVESGEKATEEARLAQEKAQQLVSQKEEEFKAKEAELVKLQSTKPDSRFPPRFRPSDDQKRLQVQNAMGDAMTTYTGQLGQHLGFYERNPEEVMRRLNQVLDSAAQALMADPHFVPAWMLKGRVHLALSELDQAQDAFGHAQEHVGEMPGFEHDPPEAMQNLVRELKNGPGDKTRKAVSALRGVPPMENEVTAELIQFFDSKPSLRRSSLNSSDPYGRKPTANEIALDVVMRNPGSKPVKVTPRKGRMLVELSGETEFKDLSPLTGLDVGSLSFGGAKVQDWTTVAALALESLDLGGSPIEAIPPSKNGYMKLKTLEAARSGLTTIEFARYAPNLESLNISETHVADLSPLGTCRRLTQLNISGLNPANFRVLAFVPLTSLTLSPLLITDKAGLDTMRKRRTALILRTPSDPERQPALEFWRKLDSGAYNQTGDVE